LFSDVQPAPRTHDDEDDDDDDVIQAERGYEDEQNIAASCARTHRRTTPCP